MAQIDDVCDFVIVKSGEAGLFLNLLKLQKIIYYAQALHLAFYGRRLFQGRFQAWVHGPVSRALYDRFKDTKSLYSTMDGSDVRTSFDANALSADEREHIGAVLEAYGSLTGSQLEEMSHNEDPWIAARGALGPAERCETEIDEDLMREFYQRQQKVSQSTLPVV